MRAVRIHRYGGPEVLQWEDIPIPKLSASQALVRIKASAMNHLDLWVRTGLPGVPLPIIPGSDGAGVIQEVGNDIRSIKPGEEVIIQPLTFCGECEYCKQGLENYCESFGIYGENQDGTQCEFMAVEERNLRLKPDFLSFEEAAAFPLVAQTAYTMLVRRARIKKGESVLVWGAGSGVGSMAIQIAKIKGCFVIATGGSDEKVKLGKELGADITVNHYTGNVSRTVRKVTDGKGVSVVFEHVGAATWGTSLRILSKGGRLVTCGATTGAKVNINLRHLFIKQQSILGSTMGDVAVFDEVLRLITEKKLRPVLDRVFPMSEIQAAHRYFENSQQFGKIILIP